MVALSKMGARLLVHAELPEFITSISDRRNYLAYMNSRPKQAEDAAIEELLVFSRESGCAVHIVHLSSADSVERLRRAREERIPVTVETCPHYLALTAEEIPDGATEFKCAPPIREAANQAALWDALRSGVIDMIASDHSPSPPDMKQRTSGDFEDAWGGIASLQLSLSVVWTEAARRGFDERDIVRWMSVEPAKLAGLSDQKGKIAAGYDADLVVWDPAEGFSVNPQLLHHRHKLTPYSGHRLRGVVKQTYVRGLPVLGMSVPCGAILRRKCTTKSTKVA
jgi:allantoinase